MGRGYIDIWKNCFDMSTDCNRSYRVTSLVWLFANEYRMYVKEILRSHANGA